MSKTTLLIKAALSLRGGAGFDVYDYLALTLDSFMTLLRPAVNFILGYFSTGMVTQGVVLLNGGTFQRTMQFVNIDENRIFLKKSAL